MSDTTTYILISLFTVFCIFPLLLLAITAFWVTRQIRDLATVDDTKIRAQFDRMRADHPQATTDELVRKMIHRQAFRCGVIGALTSFGGFFVMIFTLPIDILASARLQASMVQFIAAAYGHEQASDAEVKIRTALVMSGGIRAAQATTDMFQGFLVRFLEKAFAKLIPILGAVIGFGVNYFLAQATGNIAQRWYSGELPRLGERVINQLPPRH
jgi:uncharacterized protein (DUF697 family)